MISRGKKEFAVNKTTIPGLFIEENNIPKNQYKFRIPEETRLLVFRKWVEVTQKNPSTTKPDRKRMEAIDKAIGVFGFSVEDVLDAVCGWRKSPWHCGKNKNRTVYNQITLLLRDAEHIEKFRDLERSQGKDYTSLLSLAKRHSKPDTTSSPKTTPKTDSKALEGNIGPREATIKTTRVAMPPPQSSRR